ncbi:MULTISPECIES: VIT1/CCC1 transporter family protein [Clostridium]|jgi:VIT1/CCC1 family predicted Fe2+/Mn2+ transporter|uniref:VIT1/CCC1 transporter family protein n=1 Tax=Clostridium TaxID=1485 RepID=UPI0002882772|nr:MULTISPECIES: VIT1/CCC1 transporter family protein [Clostridium]MDF2505373.1 putative rane protein [Clostridium sp.]
MEENLRKVLITMQRNEITEKEIYIKVSKITKEENNKKIMLKIAAEEQQHYNLIRSYTNVEVSVNRIRVWFYYIAAKIFGFTFAVKQMEGRENEVVRGYSYEKLAGSFPKLSKVAEEEEKHELLLLDMLDEERLKYVGAIVLGLNDALVEITGSLAGFTLSMANTRVIALAGLITGISATLSMAASEYIAEKTEGTKNALKSSLYTGLSYLGTVILLILPFIFMNNDMYVQALIISLIVAVVIISVFNYYISVAKGLNFKKRFIQMAGVSLGVALFSFIVGLLVKNILKINL